MAKHYAYAGICTKPYLYTYTIHINHRYTGMQYKLSVQVDNGYRVCTLYVDIEYAYRHREYGYRHREYAYRHIESTLFER